MNLGHLGLSSSPSGVNLGQILLFHCTQIMELPTTWGSSVILCHVQEAGIKHPGPLCPRQGSWLVLSYLLPDVLFLIAFNYFCWLFYKLGHCVEGLKETKVVYVCLNKWLGKTKWEGTFLLGKLPHCSFQQAGEQTWPSWLGQKMVAESGSVAEVPPWVLWKWGGVSKCATLAQVGEGGSRASPMLPEAACQRLLSLTQNTILTWSYSSTVWPVQGPL